TEHGPCTVRPLLACCFVRLLGSLEPPDGFELCCRGHVLVHVGCGRQLTRLQRDHRPAICEIPSAQETACAHHESLDRAGTQGEGLRVEVIADHDGEMPCRHNLER